MKKDTTVSIRINLVIKKLLLKEGITAQKIIDEYINNKFRVNTTITKKAV